jgi:hypothetical protein
MGRRTVVLALAVVAVAAGVIALVRAQRADVAPPRASQAAILVHESAVPPERLAAYREAVAAVTEAQRRAEQEYSAEDSDVSPLAPTDQKNGQRASKRTARAHALEDELLAAVAARHNTTVEDLRQLVGRRATSTDDASKPGSVKK